MRIEKEHELILLSKALSIIRYEPINDEASYLAISPIMADLHVMVINELQKIASARGLDIANEHYIDDDKTKIEAIKYHINNIENWNTLDVESKHLIVTDLIRPNKLKDETINLLISL